MKFQVEEIRSVVNGLNSLARIGLGEDKPGGGFLGIGGKAKSKAELSKEARDLYIKGGNALNQYIFLSNEGLPVSLAKFPYL